MDAIWVSSLHGLHCPRCDRRLVQQAAIHFHSGLRSLVYVGRANTLACPGGHRLPDRQDLDAYRSRRERVRCTPVSGGAPPRC